MLTEEQYHLLQELAERTGQPVSVLVREAIDKVYFEQALMEQRQAALRRLLALDAPVADWGEMEVEISRGVLE